MEHQDLQHPAPRLPDGWKQFQADNIDVTTTSDLPPGRHSRSPSVLSNHGFAGLNIQPAQTQTHSNAHTASLADFHGGGAGLNGDLGLSTTTTAAAAAAAGFHEQDVLIAQFAPADMDGIDFAQTAESGRASGQGASNGYFHHAAAAGTAAISSATTQPLQHTLNPTTTDHAANSSFDDYYLAAADPSSSPFLDPNSFAGDTSPPIVQHQSHDSLSPFAFRSSDAQHNSLQPQSQFDGTGNNTLGLHWTHHRSFSDQSDISSNASPFIGSVHSEHGSPFIHPQTDNFADDLREAILGLDMGAPFDVAAQHYNTHQFDTSTLELDPQGFPIDAPLFEQHDQYQTYDNRQNGSRPTSSSSYHHPSFPQSIFTSAQPQNISTSLSQSYQSPPLASATSIPEIEVTVAPPTPRSQAFNSFFPPQPYNPQQTHSAQNSPSIPSSYIFNNPDPLALPPTGRRRAVSDSGTRPSFSMVPTHANLSRRVSSGSHPYHLAVQGDSPSSSGRSTPNRGHRRSVSSGHNMTHREVLDLVKNDGPREAKNPKKFICDYPNCGQRFTRNSNKTTHMLTHKNERPHVCPHCQKDFTRQHDWKRHMELHDPSKKFKCAGFLGDGRPWGCNKEFARKDALSRHFKSQQGRQCIDEVLREGRTLEDLYEDQGILGHISGNSSEDMYGET